MDRARVERLVADVRAARERQDPFAFVDLGGRLALRLQGAGGVRTSFVTSEERAAIEAAIEASPRGFVVGTVEVRFDERVRSYVARDGGVSLLFVDLPEDPPSAVTLALLSERYLWVHANEPRICEEAAVHLDRLAATWSTNPAAIRAALRLSSVTFFGTKVTPLLATGEPFGHHVAELELDANGGVVAVTLAG